MGLHFAADEPLVHVEYANDAIAIYGVDGTSPIDVVVPSPPSAGGRAVTHGNGVAAVGAVDFGHDLSVLQFAPDGTPVRELTRPLLALDLVGALDVVIAPDGSLYVSGMELVAGASEDDPNGPFQGFIMKLPPP